MSLLSAILAFEKKKIILPALLLALFAVILYAFSATGHLEDKYACNMISAFEAAESINMSDAKKSLEESVARRAEIISLLKQLHNDTRVIASVQPLATNILIVLEPIDPFVPYPCEFYPDRPFCQHYSSPETYACGETVQHLKAAGDLSKVVGFAKLRPYTNMLLTAIAANIIWLFAIGYLTSAVLLAACKKIRGKSKARKAQV